MNLFQTFLESHFYLRPSPNLARLGFNFDLDPAGEFEKIRSLIARLYLVEGESMLTLMKQFSIPSSKTMDTIFKLFGIESRSHSDAAHNAFALGSSNISDLGPKSKCGWHTNWQGESYFLRSTYELEYARMLDEAKIAYTCESLRITYFDTQTQTQRIAIPDFILPNSNSIVEIKSEYWYDRQNMIDKFEAYSRLGFKPILVLDGKEYTDPP